MSVTSDNSPKDEVSRESLVPTEAPKKLFEFTWQDLRACSQYINEEGWSQEPIPAILENFPDNIVINKQLQQILSWSLQRFDNQTTSQIQVQAEVKKENAGELSDIAKGKLPARANTVVAHSSPAAVEETITLARSKTQKSYPLIIRLKQLRQDVANKVASTQVAGTPSKKDITSTEISPAEVSNPNGECISCFDEFPKRDLVHLTCSHDYCKTCLRTVVLNAMKNESAFPPKCCLTEIPLKTVLVCLENTQRDEYREKAAEYAIPAGHRWYCPEPKCSKWIKPEKLHRNRRSQQTCPHCKAGICSVCRSLAHDENQDCPQDFGLESTLEIAESEGWRRCYSCRTMVELTTGCRHITCRCGAEFCYVCNARWRTCNCTEADKERRIRELRAQREQRAQMAEEEARRRDEEDEVARIEAEEMAEAIRQVEEMERQEAIRRVEEERQRQLEEELILAQLEEARLLEEIARRDAEEEAERQFKETLLASSKEECMAMMKTLMDIINYQHTTLMSAHGTKEQRLSEEKAYKRTQQASRAGRWQRWLHANIDRRTKILNSKQQSEWESLLLQAENEEDDMFMQMHMYLRDRPNREQREKRMRDTFQQQQREKTDQLQQKHQAERQHLEMGISYEMEGLRKATELQAVPIESNYNNALQKLGRQVGVDRRWFQLVSTRRINMLNEHKRIMLQQLEADEEPVGLTKDQVESIEPTLPETLESRQDVSKNDVIPAEVLPSQPEEISDLYGPSKQEGIADSTQSEENSNLGRSDTVIRVSIPGAYPDNSSAVSPTKGTMPASSGTSPRVPSTITAPCLPDQTSVMDRPRPRRPLPNSSADLGMTSDQPSLRPTSMTMDPNLIPSSSLNNPYQSFNAPQKLATSTDSLLISLSNTSTSTVSTTATPTSSRASTSKHSSTSTAASFSNSDADILDSISSNVIAKQSNDDNSKTKRKGFSAVLKGFGKRKEISEEEIRRRMSSTVGDSWGH